MTTLGNQMCKECTWTFGQHHPDCSLRPLTKDEKIALLLEACKEMNDLLKAITPVIYNEKVYKHLPFGVYDRVVDWVHSTKTDSIIAKAKGEA